MNTPDTEKRPTYKEVKEEIKKTDYFKSLDEDGNPPDTEWTPRNKTHGLSKLDQDITNEDNLK